MCREGELEQQRRRAYAQRSTEERKTAGLALGVGEAVPEFRLPSITGPVADSRELLSRGPLVISFYCGGWCPYCNIELRALQGRLPEIEALGASLVVISPELPDRAAVNARSNALAFPMLYDEGSQVARRFRHAPRGRPRHDLRAAGPVDRQEAARLSQAASSRIAVGCGAPGSADPAREHRSRI